MIWAGGIFAGLGIISFIMAIKSHVNGDNKKGAIEEQHAILYWIAAVICFK